ncbi:MAG: hypothetical protein EOP22_17620 [Hyphomicrobiales bacterium]|nr:MAG: hypothetical protein EOP22_17620 [Hyphomicrobiales bacterium]
MRLLPRAVPAVLAALGCAMPALAQESAAPDGIDWSVGLRGSYVTGSGGAGRAELLLTPEASLALAGGSTETRLDAGGEFIVDSTGQVRVANVRAGAESTLRVDAETTLTGSIDSEMRQLRPDDSSLPLNTLTAPLDWSTSARGSATREFGPFTARVTLDGERLTRGPTTLDDLSTIDNSDQSYWQGGATLRLGYAVTPLLDVFVEGEASAQKFDAPSPVLLTYLDGRTYEARAGLSYAHGTAIAAEASIGRAWLDYVDPGLTDAPSWVYNASLSVRPDETLELEGALETTLGPSATVAGDTDVTISATQTARYSVNPLLTLRGSAGWNQTNVLGAGDVSWGYEIGAGLDYRSSRHVVWTADYLFRRDEAPPAPASDTHSVSVGVRVER